MRGTADVRSIVGLPARTLTGGRLYAVWCIGPDPDMDPGFTWWLCPDPGYSAHHRSSVAINKRLLTKDILNY